jgi:hypothetical protein
MPKPLMAVICVATVAVVVAIVLATSGGSGLNMTRVGESLDSHFSATPEGKEIRWHCEPLLEPARPSCVAEVIGVGVVFSPPAYDIESSGEGAGCYTGNVEHESAKQATEDGLPETITQCY